MQQVNQGAHFWVCTNRKQDTKYVRQGWQSATFEGGLVGADMDVDAEEVLALDGPVSRGVPANAAQVTNKRGAAAVHLER